MINKLTLDQAYGLAYIPFFVILHFVSTILNSVSFLFTPKINKLQFIFQVAKNGFNPKRTYTHRDSQTCFLYLYTFVYRPSFCNRVIFTKKIRIMCIILQSICHTDFSAENKLSIHEVNPPKKSVHCLQTLPTTKTVTSLHDAIQVCRNGVKSIGGKPAKCKRARNKSSRKILSKKSLSERVTEISRLREIVLVSFLCPQI